MNCDKEFAYEVRDIVIVKVDTETGEEVLYEVKVSGLVTRELQVEAESGSQAQEIAKTMFCEMLLAYPENVEVE